MRIGIGGLFHETNSFSNIPVDQPLLRRRWLEAEDMVKWHDGVKSYVGGFLDEAKEQKVDIVPCVHASQDPSGHITQDTLEALRDRLVEMLWEAHEEKPLDAIALHLHGAAVADGYPDADGEVIRAIREKFGKDMPIGVVLDLHANVTAEMVELSDILYGIKCYPHVDMYESARAMFAKLCDMARKNLRPCKSRVTLPWLIVPAEGLTTAGPAHDVQQLCLRHEAEDPALWRATFFHGFPYADIEPAGVSVVTMARDQETADRHALEIARYAWDRRPDFKVKANSAYEAFELALQVPEGDGPVVINESSDNTGGGAPGDGTHLLREMLKRNLPGSAMCYIYDPEVALQAAKAGVGATIRCTLGAKMDALHGEPLELEAYVKTVSDGNYINQNPMSLGSLTKLGLTVCLVVDNVSIVVCSGRNQPLDDGALRIVGLRHDLLKFVGVKSSQHFKGWWAGRCRDIIPCDSPGIHCADLTVFDFQYTNTSYYPLQNAKWSCYE